MRLRDALELQQEMNRAFREAGAWRRSPAAAPTCTPPLDITRTATSYQVRVDLPGVPAESLRVYAEDGAISLVGAKPAPPPPDARPLRQERASGHFSQTIALPSDADLSACAAAMRQGVLEITVGRTRPTAGVRIEITVTEA